MRAYKVSCEYTVETEDPDDSEATTTEIIPAVCYAGTQADAASIRRTFKEEYDLKLNDIEIEEIEIPTDKSGLLSFINDLINPETE